MARQLNTRLTCPEHASFTYSTLFTRDPTTAHKKPFQVRHVSLKSKHGYPAMNSSQPLENTRLLDGRLPTQAEQQIKFNPNAVILYL